MDSDIKEEKKVDSNLVQQESSDTSTNTQDSKDIIQQATDSNIKKVDMKEIQYFHCSSCNLKEKYDYFGNSPHFFKNYKLREEAYLVEDPFLPPKKGEIIILGAHCIKCNRSVCKDINCSFYHDGTHCIQCAKENRAMFPLSVQEKLNKIVN